MKYPKYNFPNSKRFAFTILDDTDDATVENIKPIYDYLTEKGIFISKTVWPLACLNKDSIFSAGETLSNENYLEVVKGIEKQGHKIAFHCASMESSDREKTKDGLKILENSFSEMPRVFCNHGKNMENIYWGKKRFRSPFVGLVYKVLNKNGDFYGDDENSIFFWGDLHRKYFKYSRNLTFASELNILNVNPCMPFQDSKKKYSNFWFSTTDISNVVAFKNIVTKEKIDRVEEENGCCILSTHLGKGFCHHSEINSYFKEMIEYVAGKGGWFVPVGELLDFLLLNKNDDVNNPISNFNLMKLEWKYFIDMLRR